MQRFTTSDGLALAYRDDGAGKPILCLSGLTRDANDFDDLAAVLPSSLRLIRLDYRGRGQSDWADPATYQIPIEARDVIELLDHLRLDKVAIVGTSRGGLIAMVLASMAKHRLSGVLLNDIGPEIAKGGLGRIMDYLGVQPASTTFDEAAAGLKQALGQQFPDLDDARWLALAQRWFGMGEGGLTLTYDPDLRTAMAAAEIGKAPDLWPLFDALAGLPLAALRGALSDLLSGDTFARMQERRPDMIAATVPGRGHVPFLDEPESQRVFEDWIALL